MVDINVYDGIIVKEKLVSLPPLLFPVGTDPLNVPDHSLAHRVFAQTGNSPEGSVSVDANGNVVILGSIKNPLFQDLQSEFAFAQLIRFQELLYDINGNLITINIWEDNTKSTKLYQKDFAYVGGDLSTITVTRISDSFSYVKTLSYSLGTLESIEVA